MVTNTAWTYSFSYWEPVCCSMSSSNCCFLTCLQVSQEAGQVVGYPHLFQNFPPFIVIHTVKGFGIVHKVEIDVFFWNSLAFSMIQQMLAIWSLVPLPFLKPAWISGHLILSTLSPFSFIAFKYQYSNIYSVRWNTVIYSFFSYISHMTSFPFFLLVLKAEVFLTKLIFFYHVVVLCSR